jgi:hypothetical protein
MFRLGAQFITIVESAIEIRSMTLSSQESGGGLQCRLAHCRIMFARLAQGECSRAGD